MDILLAGKRTFQELLESFKKSKSTLSFHLSKFSEAGILVVEHAGKESVYSLSEPDKVASQALYIRPYKMLKGGTRYAVAIKKTLKAKGGGELPISEGFQAILDGEETTHPLLEKVRPRYKDIFAALEQNGIAKSDLVVAWDFTTRSRSTADQDTFKNKLLKLVPFTALGIVAGMVFMNGQHGVRYFIHIPGRYATDANGMVSASPNPPAFTSALAHSITNLDLLDWKTFELLHEQAVYSPQTLALLLGGFLLYMSSVLLIVSIPLMAKKNKAGWYIATATALATVVVSFQGFVVRHSTEWLQGGMLSLILLIILLIPTFKKFLFRPSV